MSVVIKAENISKAYQLGEFSTGTLTKDIERWWMRMQGKEDPFMSISETNDRTVKGQSNIVWSLKDISFDIKRGDAVGIIGRNGAGKSTLLKILSRVTTPTTGSVKIKGRIASLLEVGTGFHPELTGRENIFLNGAILGMQKQEIKKKFDEIVEFSGVQRYVDTPVKRYSSGMYVRLAFAVAAHLESEILIVDEVLAVGDAEFQKKCLGKIGDVSREEGRTVLFVSHNMGAIKRLCNKGIYLDKGLLAYSGTMNDTLDKYYASYQTIEDSNNGLINIEEGVVGMDECYLTSLSIIQDGKSTALIDPSKPTFLEIGYTIKKPLKDFSVSINIVNQNDDMILHTSDIFAVNTEYYSSRQQGNYLSRCIIPPNYLNEGNYSLNIGAEIPNEKEFFFLKSVLAFNVESISEKKTKYTASPWRGMLNPESVQWKLMSA